MRQLRAKIKSRTGASIVMALLLFMVCAMVCTVVVVAASTAGGRMSQLRKSDRRYYAVTSAAELLSDVFAKAPMVTVTETTGEGGAVTRTASGTTDALLTDAAIQIVTAMAAGDQTQNLSLTAGGISTLECSIVETAKQNGLMVLTISNDGFSLDLVLSSNIRKLAADPARPGETVTEVTWKMNSIKSAAMPTSAPAAVPTAEG